MLGLSLCFSYSQRKSISCKKDYSTVKTELSWSVIVADNFGVTDNVHFLGRLCLYVCGCVCACACSCVCLCMHVCVCLMCVCLAFRVMLNGMTKVATPLLPSSSSLGRPISVPRNFELEILVDTRVLHPMAPSYCCTSLATDPGSKKRLPMMSRYKILRNEVSQLIAERSIPLHHYLPSERQQLKLAC